jgi:hypothetical protein
LERFRQELLDEINLIGQFDRSIAQCVRVVRFVPDVPCEYAPVPSKVPDQTLYVGFEMRVLSGIL